MSGFLTKILGAKKECKAMEARASALPADDHLAGTTSYRDTWRTSLNRAVASKLAH